MKPLKTLGLITCISLIAAILWLPYTFKDSSLSNPIDSESKPVKGEIVWLKSPSGVLYSYDCIDGVRYIATKSSYTGSGYGYTGKSC